MKVLGLSPLDKDATVSLVEDGRVLFAAAEERFSRIKQHAGFPHQALAATLEATGTRPEEIDLVVYPFLEWQDEARLMRQAIEEARVWERSEPPRSPAAALDEAARRAPRRRADAVHGLLSPEQRMDKGLLKSLLYRALGTHPLLSRWATRKGSRNWLRGAVDEHCRRQAELEQGLAASGLRAPLRRGEHHASHAAACYLASGFERALVVTLDGYGSGLTGSISLGEGGHLKRLHGLAFPHSLGTFYEAVTSSLGFSPDRHAGKIVGLAAFGDPTLLEEVLAPRVLVRDGDLRLHQNLNIFFSRHLASRFAMVDVAAAWQAALERAAQELVAAWLARTGCDALVLSGGVAANVKMNQRLHELPGVKATFVDPDMGDGGCGTGMARMASWPGGPGEPLDHVYLGPEYGRAELEQALRQAGLSYEEPADLAEEVARRLHAGRVVARFDGRLEYGPRALGNRSILYHAREQGVNRWLNERLGRTEFMPFAPVTTWEARHRCFHGLAGAEHTARFMTMTFDCTDWMKQTCPAAVHVDGSARPQLISREHNPGYYDILAAYERLSGIPCLVNTSFNMHEEPIVATPGDAVRSFLRGHLDDLVLGPFLARSPEGDSGPRDHRG